MNLKVHVPAWVLEEDHRVLRLGDELRSWLTFHEIGPADTAGPVQTVHGVAHLLASWAGAELGRHPTRIDVDGGALYWDAPEPVDGEVELTGTVRHNTIDAPDRFPETLYVVRGLSMEWQELTHQGGQTWGNETGTCRYEDVTETHLPEHSWGTSWVRPTSLTHWSGVLVDAELTGLRDWTWSRV